MSGEALLPKERLADGAITKHRLVKPGSAAGDAAQASAATDKIIGIAEHTAADNKQVRILQAGITLLEAGAAVAEGDQLTSDASGKGVAAVATNRVGAIALEAASADGDLIRVQVLLGSAG